MGGINQVGGAAGRERRKRKGKKGELGAECWRPWVISLYKWPSNLPGEEQPLLLGEAGMCVEGILGHQEDPPTFPRNAVLVFRLRWLQNDHKWGPGSHAWISELRGGWEIGARCSRRGSFRAAEWMGS